MRTGDPIPIAFWLLPAETDSHWLDTRIRTLAEQHGGQSFEPHITLHAGHYPPETDVEAVLFALAQREQRAGLDLKAGRTQTSAVFFKALFVDFPTPHRDGAGLHRLRRNLVEELLKASTAVASTAATVITPAAIGKALKSYEFLPHLSLLYGDFPRALGLELAAANDVEGRTLRFDRVAAVRPKAGHTDLSRVEGWQVFGHRRLDG